MAYGAVFGSPKPLNEIHFLDIETEGQKKEVDDFSKFCPSVLFWEKFSPIVMVWLALFDRKTLGVIR